MSLRLGFVVWIGYTRVNDPPHSLITCPNTRGNSESMARQVRIKVDRAF
jgi:hypothetical protein